MNWTWGYGTNGFTDHPLPSALDVLQHHGYGAVALTLGHPHLDPFASDWREQSEALAADLRRRGLRVVVETGARYLLDPLRKHRPTLVDRDAASRMAFLRRAVEIAAILDAECVSLWSGVVPDDVSTDQARVLLEERLVELAAFAADAGVTLALEPEPGMLVETVADALALRARLGHPANLGLTVDLGHCVVVEPDGVVGALRAAGPLLRNVQADDMLPTAHEHLPFGEGELDLDAALSTLREIDYRGVIAVELPRHAHAAPELAASSMAALVAAGERSVIAPTRSAVETPSCGDGRPLHPWTALAVEQVRADAARAARLFAAAGREVGRDPSRPRRSPRPPTTSPAPLSSRPWPTAGPTRPWRSRCTAAATTPSAAGCCAASTRSSRPPPPGATPVWSSSRTPSAPTTPGSSPRPLGPSPPITSTTTRGVTAC